MTSDPKDAMSTEVAEREAVYVRDERTGAMTVSTPAFKDISNAVHIDPPAPQQHACPKLSEALSLARDRCKMANKDKRNEFHKYAYASADEIIQTAKDALSGTGLAIIPQVQELTVLGVGNTALYALNRTIFLSHSSGEFVPLSVRGWPVIQEKGKPLDKAFAVALTTSLSYLLRDLLQMPRGDDSDMNARNDTASKPAARPAAAPAPTQPPTDQRSPGILRNTLGKLIRDAAKASDLEPGDVYLQLRDAMFHKFPELPATTSGWEKPELEYALETIGTLKLAREPGIDPEDDGIGEPPVLPPQEPAKPGQKLPPAFVNQLLGMLEAAGIAWPVARSKATEWAGYSMRDDRTLAELSLDEAGRLRGWVEAKVKKAA